MVKIPIWILVRVIIEEDKEDKMSFHGDSSNMNSSESDCPTAKKKRRVPPPNPPIGLLYYKHTFNPTWIRKQVNSTWITRAYENEVMMNQDWPTASFLAKVVNDLQCNIFETMMYRALRKAKESIIGKHEDEFKKLYQYAKEVKKVMPTSTIKLMTVPAEYGIEGRRFKRLYVCLGPLKESFLEGCRPLIGLDGCHLNGPFGGILLSAVATDPNEGMFPIA